ncbi:putative ATP-dependent RNA helicase T26G10.1 [Astathelohania contejeani]|uniref:ATP-dependent RNA helicase T26G10.1 n=1 Tax=Astathelohania contejeani TaxID=164912 RepID=A0ABQ7I0B1_9MICR|nr:putative ATP-dependent RNA helicase T26G10.1 [Thelohania contejeani]
MGFKNINEELIKHCKSLNYVEPTQIQNLVIPYMLKGRDIIAISKTGTGKTLCFCLPIMNNLLKRNRAWHSLILTPTRELATQIAEEFQKIGNPFGLRISLITGGGCMSQQKASLAQKPHVIIATPGRFADHIKNSDSLGLKKIRYLVLDEADRLLEMDFGKDIEIILDSISNKRHTFLFSATINDKVEGLARLSLKNPQKFELSKSTETVDTLEQKYILVPEKYKEIYLYYILKENEGRSILVFVATTLSAEVLGRLYQQIGMETLILYGSLKLKERSKVINEFKSRKNMVMIATDVASRGLDIPHIDLVINYDVPITGEDYIHRVGRTARAGRTGKAITIITQYDIGPYQKIEAYLGVKLTDYKLDREKVMANKERINSLKDKVVEKGKQIVYKKSDK